MCRIVKYTIEVKVNNTVIGVVTSTSRENAYKLAESKLKMWKLKHPPINQQFRDEYDADLRDF